MGIHCFVGIRLAVAEILWRLISLYCTRNILDGFTNKRLLRVSTLFIYLFTTTLFVTISTKRLPSGRN